MGGLGETLRRWASGRWRLYEEGEDPDYRFSLANERTFLAWIRTSLALLAGGVAIVQLVPSLGVREGRHVLGIALMVLGTMLAAVSHWRWWRAERAMRLKQTLSGSLLVPLMAYGLTVVALGALVLVLWFGSGAR
jgi:putative membrane protein